ncbi:CCA tRNA nucleotidyltransferase [Fructilactobacillus cliffordii]|uniref:CCA-adding enzyme n=1 Tax=Fructilactobacillus cliffordii TaxID=2940299 RepID=A0A9Q8ZW57_9LACO|nr:CCA tRNA nucleotidyltransferase [Fructilactobacillus cliffordii]USS89621.1 CCA tRNA nucleotidyltransferase [Fructilactobacillus cliffordii]
MRIEKLPAAFIGAQQVLQVIEKHGYEAYFVGGSVRDTLLNLPIHDVDLATSAYPAEIKQIFPRTIDTGIEHGTVTVLHHKHSYEITTFRTESGYQDYRRPDRVTFVRSLREDLMRRDFTVNALAMRENGEVIDLFSGISDLRRHIIRAVGNPNERFHEDALRMMRAVRFGSQLDFTIEAATMAAIQTNSPLLEKIAVERIHVEFVKMLLGIAPLRGFQQMLTTDLLRYVPVLNDEVDSIAALIKHPLAQRLADETQVWSWLAFSLGWNAPRIRKTLQAWKSSKQLISAVTSVTSALQALLDHQLTNWRLYKTGAQNLATAAQVAVVLGHDDETQSLQQRYDQLPIHNKHELNIDGKQLIQAGVKPGPQLGQLLNQLEQQVVAGTIANEQDQLLAAARTQSEA